MVVFVNDPPSADRRIDFAVFFIVLWFYGRKIVRGSFVHLIFNSKLKIENRCQFLIFHFFLPLEGINMFHNSFYRFPL